MPSKVELPKRRRETAWAAIFILVGVWLISGKAEAQSPTIIPQAWSEVPKEGRWPGRRFVSPDGSAWLGVYASPARERSPRDFMDAIAYKEGERITYHRRGPGWIAVSGLKGQRIFYRESNLACRGTRWHSIVLEYPASDKRKMH